MVKISKRRQQLYWWMSWIWWTTCVNPWFFRQRTTGHTTLPDRKAGTYLLLSNHASLLDPAWATYKISRPAHFMASSHIFRVPVFRTMIRAMGAFPKKKFTRDAESVAYLEELYADDQVVVLFPEGQRTWDGRPVHVRDGIGRLIKRMNARVVFCRNHTGHLIHPRWAKYPRWLPLVIEYSPPTTFPEHMSPEEITEQVVRGIRIDPDSSPPGRTFGRRMAHGLPDYLWACPSCFTARAVQVHPRRSNDVLCSSCGAHWTVTGLSRLTPRSHGAPPMSVRDAYDRISQHFGDQPTTADHGCALRCAHGVVLKVPRQDRKSPVELARGELRLTAEALEINRDGETRWRLAMSDVSVITIEMGNVLTVRSGDTLLQLDTGADSPLMWGHFINLWWHQLNPQRPRPNLPG